MFGVESRKPFAPSSNEQRAKRVIAAGVNVKTLSTFMGRETTSITQDLYGHPFPGTEDEAGSLLDAYLTRADKASRLAQLTGNQPGIEGGPRSAR